MIGWLVAYWIGRSSRRPHKSNSKPITRSDVVAARGAMLVIVVCVLLVLVFGGGGHP